MTRFYLLELHGRKIVRLVPPSEFYRTDSPDMDKYQPMIFGVDLFNPDFKAHPGLDGMLVYEALLGAGDVLYVPEGWAHQALNLEWTLMTSTNIVDQHDMHGIKALLHFEGVRLKGYSWILQGYSWILQLAGFPGATSAVVPCKLLHIKREITM
jgi:hypothetical protein